MTSVGTFCPQCFQSTLVLFVPPPIERMLAVPESNNMSAAGQYRQICEGLINKFTVTRVSDTEASKPKDYIVKDGADKRKRIDRQGPVMRGGQVTHAKFAVQLGDPIYAGIWMPIDTDFSIQHVRAAFIQSLDIAHQYVRIYWE